MTDSAHLSIISQRELLGVPGTEVPELPRDQVLANRELWLTALRSDDYVQGTGALRAPEFGSPGYRHCCLGVAEDVRGASWNDHDMVVGPQVTIRYVNGLGERRLGPLDTSGTTLTGWGQVWLGVRESDPFVAVPVPDESTWVVHTLTVLNDELGFSFARIADVVELQGPDWDGSDSQAHELARSRTEVDSRGTDA